MNTFTDNSIDRIVVVASSQVGKTETELNMLGYLIDQDPGPVMFVMPTVDNAEDFSKRRIDPMVRDTIPIRDKMRAARGTKSTTKKAFPGGMLTLTGSNSPASLASIPARYVFGDEIDRWSRDAGGEGDPWGLLEASIIARKHADPRCVELMEAWWEAFLANSRRDQISLIDTLWKAGIEPGRVGVLGSNLQRCDLFLQMRHPGDDADQPRNLAELQARIRGGSVF